MMEVGVVIALDGSALHWHMPPGRSSVALPDSPDLWDVIWENRNNLLGIAHSHPGNGVPGPSWEDITTFASIEAGLGRRLRWWITSGDRFAEFYWTGPEKYDYTGREVSTRKEVSYLWLPELRAHSYNNDSNTHATRGAT